MPLSILQFVGNLEASYQKPTVALAKIKSAKGGRIPR
jgi:hypothetical protein